MEYPAIEEEEIGALRSAGLHPEIDEAEKKRGKLKVNIRVSIFGKERVGSVLYPDLYPYLRPTVIVPGLGEDLRHYSPGGELCLLARGTDHWQPNDTAAGLITKQLGKWERVATRKYEDERLQGEDHQAEPWTEFYRGARQQIMFDSSWVFPDSTNRGLLHLSVAGDYKHIQKGRPFVGWLLVAFDNGNVPIDGVSINPMIHQWIKSQEYKRVQCPWFRLPSLPSSEAFVESIRAMSADLFSWLQLEIKKKKHALFAVCVPEENPRGGIRDGWLFYYVAQINKQDLIINPIKVEYAGECDIFERIPELNPLRGKKIAVIGLGCVGAPSAIAFARAGIGEIRLLDGDFISAGTICRWPIGLQAMGKGKVKALIDYITSNYPLTNVSIDHHLSGTEDDRVMLGTPEVGQKESLFRMLDGVDLVFDATAERGINQMLSLYAKELSVPYVTVASRPGGWGGHVVRVLPAQTGCLLCFWQALEKAENEPENEDNIELPAFDPNGDKLQPVGCGDITFHAASFDVEEVSLAGVRMAVSTLCEGIAGAYPPLVDDIGILSLRSSGIGLFPKWNGYSFDKIKKCKSCAPYEHMDPEI